MFTILIVIEFIIKALPRKFALGLGSSLGFLGFCLDARHRALAISNIERALCLSRKKAKKIALKSFQNFGENIVEFILDGLDTLVLQGRENVNVNQGNIFVLGHFGNWEIMGRVAKEYNVKITAVGRKIKNSGVDKYLKRRRAGDGLEVVDKKWSFGSLINALKAGRMVAILIDQYAGRKGVFVKFLGLSTSTIASPVLLALKTGCPIVPVFIIKDGGKHKFIVERPIEVKRSGNIAKDLEVNTQLMVKPLEKYVRMYPEQWWWVHRRWR